MDAEEKLKSKHLYKLTLFSIKIIPVVIAGIYLLNTVLSYCGLDLEILSYIVFFLLLAFLYLVSYVFRFCRWHRMFLHYILLNTIINVTDYYIGIPISDWHMFNLYIIITGIFVFLIVYFKVKQEKRDKQERKEIEESDNE